jgi:hypothetical protein
MIRNVRRDLLFAFTVAFLFAFASAPSFAHHSMSAYDSSRSVTLKATITEFAWTNPHVQIHFEVRDDNGNVEAWMAECPSPSRLSRGGWSEDTLKPGDQISITGNPAKDGAKEMRLQSVMLADGQQMIAYRR